MVEYVYDIAIMDTITFMVSIDGITPNMLDTGPEEKNTNNGIGPHNIFLPIHF